MFRDRLLVSLALTGPVLYFSVQIQKWFSYEAVSLPLDHLVPPVLRRCCSSTPVACFSVAVNGS